MSELSTWVAELRNALAAEHAKPLPCSGLQALHRTQRVYLARCAVFNHMSKGL